MDDFNQIIQARRHDTQVEVDGRILKNLYDDAHIKVSFNLKCYAIYCIFYFDSLTCFFFFFVCLFVVFKMLKESLVIFARLWRCLRL